MDAGSSYVYYTRFLPGLVGTLANKTESLSVGTNYGGVLNSPNSGSAVIPIPVTIPNMAVVIVQ
ncbi:PilM [compost metagenome]